MRAAAVALGLALLAPGAGAQEFVTLPEPLSDLDFYRAVACAAEPGGPCRKPFLRWPEDRRGALTAGLVSTPDALPPDHAAPFDAALDAAIAAVNGAGSEIGLARDDAAPDIAVHVVSTPPGGVIEGTGVAALDGFELPFARVALRTRDGVIGEAVIAVSVFAAAGDARSVLLEEVVQALGLMTDVAGPAYARSIFAEEANAAVTLDGQDAAALRLHYPEEG